MEVKLKRCSVCGKERINIDFNDPFLDSDEPIWKSDLKMVMSHNDFEIMRFTVCPNCRRKHTL
ncbi:MAG: hypothetical protein ACOCT9_02530, partial [archaeon]